MQRQLGWRAAHSLWADWIAIDRVAGSPKMHDRTYIIWQSEPIEPERFAQRAGELAEPIDAYWNSDLLLEDASTEYVNAVRCGFPLRCAIGWVEHGSGQRRPVHLWGDTANTWWRGKPARILTVPFLLNVLIYVGLAYMTMLVLRVLKRAVWRRRTIHNCGHCGYDLSGSIGTCCPECGDSHGEH